MGVVDQKYGSWRRRLPLVAKGFGMGVADLIPGISGGTIAFITGIYEEWMAALQSFDRKFLSLLLSRGPRYALRYLDWQFLVLLLSGIGLAVFSLSSLLHTLLERAPQYLFGFFFGLIAVSCPLIARRIRASTRGHWLTGLMGAVLMWIVAGMIPVQTPTALPFYFFYGAVAICAMVLPGISGSFILLLLGQYSAIISALHEKNFVLLAVFAAGCGVGILTFVHVVNLCLRRWHDFTLAFLCGLVLGSLKKVWPWQALAKDGAVAADIPRMVWPSGSSGETWGIVALMVFGGMLGFYLETSFSSRENQARKVETG